MGAFFLLGGTLLFFAGLGCLVIVFISLARRLKASKSTSVYVRSRSSYRDGILTGVGILLIVVAQGFYWFHEEVGNFIPFDESIPQTQVSFLYEEFRTPRMVIQGIDQNNQMTAQLIPLTGTKVSIGVETIRWAKAIKMLGVKDCYHINGVYYYTVDSTFKTNYSTLPDYALNGGPSGFVTLANVLGKSFPGELKLKMSSAFEANPKSHFLMQITPDSIYASQEVDNPTTANYSKQ